MQRLYTTIIALITAISLSAQGWPSNYDGVMLQGFYWDSYDDSKWTKLESQADELSQYFNLIWIPNSGKTSSFYHDSKSRTMGYDPCFWLDHNTCFGTQEELKKMIQTFKAKGTGIIEDVVINHKNGLNTWVDFPDEEVGSYKITWDNTDYSAICVTDECNSSTNLNKWSKNGKKTSGAADTGSDFSGYRDLDHTNDKVQENVKTYLNFLTKELGYIGFRYDMVAGFSAKYTGEYNKSSAPDFSVGEYWADGGKTAIVNWINGTKVDGKIQSAAFDFTTKWAINAAFGGGAWSRLSDAALANDKDYSRYGVTFVDNHDTYRTDEGKKDKLNNNICAANAYILTMPGTPCLFLKHWQMYKGTLKRLVALRKAAGITNESEILSAKTNDMGFEVSVKGKNGILYLYLGNVNTESINTTADVSLAVSGKKYAIYASSGIDLTTVKAITEVDESPEDDTPVEIPAFCKVNENETCAFFVAPKTWGSQIYCWKWDSKYNYTGGNWPGVKCDKLGEDSKGNSVWKWTYKTSDQKSANNGNSGIIFSDGSNQTSDLSFTNGGYYNQEGLQAVVSATGINSIYSNSKNNDVYSLDGRLVRTDSKLENLPKGIYIVNKKKVILK
jgi:alpha-amylase